MEVVALPVPEHGFDSHISCIHVGHDKEYTQMSHKQRFSDNTWVNILLRRGHWRNILSPSGMLLSEFRALMEWPFNLDKDIASCLVFKYKDK